MYNLIVSANADSFEGEPFALELGRSVREYTEEAITAQYGALDALAVAALLQLPTLFAYENGNNKAPRFGRLTDIVLRRAHGMVRLDYELMPVEPFLTHDQMAGLGFELDISKWELNRTHWAVKDVELPKELHRIGVRLPDWTRRRAAINVAAHAFDVGLSFPGEARSIVEAVAQHLERLLGPDSDPIAISTMKTMSPSSPAPAWICCCRTSIVIDLSSWWCSSVRHTRTRTGAG